MGLEGWGRKRGEGGKGNEVLIVGKPVQNRAYSVKDTEQTIDGWCRTKSGQERREGGERSYPLVAIERRVLNESWKVST